MTLRLLPLLLLAALSACTAAPAGDSDSDTDTDTEAPPAGPVVTEDLGDGSHETAIDATAEEAWTYFDFESQAHHEPADPADDPTWDLAALRFNLKTNGGTSGTGGATVARLDDTTFDAVTAVPTGGWVADTATAPGVGGSPSANTSPGYAFDNWFDYDLVEHVLRPAENRVYVIRTPEGNHFKLEMLGFYDDAGTPGFVRFRWAALPAA